MKECIIDLSFCRAKGVAITSRRVWEGGPLPRVRKFDIFSLKMCVFSGHFFIKECIIGIFVQRLLQMLFCDKFGRVSEGVPT